MKLTRSAPLTVGPLGIVALLNVVLMLLFFFLLGSSFVLQPGVMVSRLPYSPFNLPPQGNDRLVTLQPGPPLRIFYRDHRVTLEELGRQLAADHATPRTIKLLADGGTPYEAVVAVMNQAMLQEYTVHLATMPSPAQPTGTR